MRRMTLTDFLVARGIELLEAESCKFQRLDDGLVFCECDVPTERAKRTIEWIDLVRWCDLHGGDTFLRMMGDVYATHPDYQSEWHRIGSTS